MTTYMKSLNSQICKWECARTTAQANNDQVLVFILDETLDELRYELKQAEWMAANK